LRVVSWNLRRAGESSAAWEILRDIDADIMLLQEVGGCPKDLFADHDFVAAQPSTKSGNKQKFQTLILSKYPLNQNSSLTCGIPWVRKELDHFSGNIVVCSAQIAGARTLNLVAVYSPAWPIPEERLEGIDYSDVQLINNPRLYCTEILWALLRDTVPGSTGNWLIGGDFNSSVLFDKWGARPRGNQEIVDRMNSLDLFDSVSAFFGKPIPTFRNVRGGKVVHQLDYLYVDSELIKNIEAVSVIGNQNILEDAISDHLPVIADFNLQM
jgi:endonuclease/exonuclease/phosphatase family metal-dependent hydrolase